MNLKEASTYFDGVTRFNDNSFQCKCPVHNDHTASMTVSKGKKGILIYCHAGCETKSILETVGLRESDRYKGKAGLERPTRTQQEKENSRNL